jgi:hypothetical protein
MIVYLFIIGLYSSDFLPIYVLLSDSEQMYAILKYVYYKRRVYHSIEYLISNCTLCAFTVLHLSLGL